MPLLYGMHDDEGQGIVPDNGWCVGLVALSENPPSTIYNPRVNWIVRVNWGYGSTGTIPLSGTATQDYLYRLGKFVADSVNMDTLIIGNEPNHANERPNSVYITPEMYAEFFVKARDLIKAIKPNIKVAPAPYAPYQISSLPEWREVLERINARGGCDALSIHTYTRSMNPADIVRGTKMDAPLQDNFNGFMSYLDCLSVVPPSMRHLPVDITEFNVWPDWEDRNTGVVKAAFGEINTWNQRVKESGGQGIRSLSIFRWKSYPEQLWGIEDKEGVKRDFVEATQRGYQSYIGGQEAPSDHKLVLPYLEKETKAPERSVSFVRDLDPEAKNRGVSIVEINGKPGETVWKVKKVEYLDERESQGRHHIYFDTLDEAGNRVVGVPILVSWPTGNTIVTSEAKPGEPWSANFPMSTGKNAFSAMVNGQSISDMVRGIGMGADTPGGFNAGIHTSTVVIFQKVKGEEMGVPSGLNNLVHPVKNPSYRRITQLWGKRPEFYRRYSVDGVPLKGHNGIDYGTPVGAEIVAVDAGRAVEVRNDPDGYGLYVKLVHPWGESIYAHLSNQMVSVGEYVQRGQRIGLSGNTGNSSGAHLHFGMRKNPYNRRDGWGGYINPFPFLEANSKPEPSTPPPPRLASYSEVVSAIKQAAKDSGMEWELIASVAWAESSFRPHLQDGLMQIGNMAWSDWAGAVAATDRNNLLDNARVGAVYLRWLIGYFDNNLYKALLAYNWGADRVIAGNTPPEKTVIYAHKVIHGRDLLKAVGS